MKEQPQMSDDIRAYFDMLDSSVDLAYSVALRARKLGYDPEDRPDIPLAKNMAERVEGLVSVVAPQIIGKGVPRRLTELEKKYGAQDWRVAMKIAEEIARERFCRFSSRLEGIQMGIRVGMAYITMGTVSSPLEGFVGITLKKTGAGKEYFSLNFSGPIRSAGGTAAAVSVILCDYLRQVFEYGSYDPTEEETQRMATELYDYHERVTNLQYLPSREEITFMVSHMPVQIDGDPSESIEVSNYKDIPRIGTNKIRNGICLVIGEGLCQKAPKVWSRLSRWMTDFSLANWSFLEEFVSLQKKIKSKGASGASDKKDKASIKPVYTYIADLVAGRPVLSHPLASGGFRLRYGRCRNSGYSSACIHPSLTYATNKFIATGTQLKVERPGKAASVSVCDSIEPPIVLLKDGSVVRLDSPSQARSLMPEISEILYLGDMLFNYGDFLNRAHALVTPGYCEEWWILELEKASVGMFGTIDPVRIGQFTEVPSSIVNELLSDPLSAPISAQFAERISEKMSIPYHPRYTYHWKSVSQPLFTSLLRSLETMSISREGSIVKKIVLRYDAGSKRCLELAGVPHKAAQKEYIVLEGDHAHGLSVALGLTRKNIEGIQPSIKLSEEKDPFDAVLALSPVSQKDKSGVFIGARMGRPEKAKIRKLTGSPHVLFPVGDEGGKMRSIQSAQAIGKVTADFSLFSCHKCGTSTIFSVCERCGKKTKKMYYCKTCGTLQKEECPHGPALPYKSQEIDINYYFNLVSQSLGMTTYPEMIKGVRGTSNRTHVPEHLAKGLLRAKHDIYVNKDGTTRYDMTQLAITHFKPCEVQTTVDRLKELGYSKDTYGKSLTSPNQVLELKPLDIILPSCTESIEEGADKVLFRVSRFVDDLLQSLYKAEPYYKLKNAEDITGHLVLCLAPHTSAGIVGRIIGFSKTQGFYAHPMVHAAMRRDCDGDEACVTLLLDALLNFSRQYLPGSRGSTQDAPLVLTSRLIPSEVDDMAFDMDVAWRYPLEFYEACLDQKSPREVDIDIIAKRLNTPRQYEGQGFTHPVSDINLGARCSAYKTLPSMQEKLTGQMDLADRIRAVDPVDVARLVIEKHFLRDIRGNLRKFSQQEFRCVACNEKYRRPPLSGRCAACGGKIIFTISEGSIIKYLGPAISLADKYHLPGYIRQTLTLTKMLVDDLFGKEKEKQEALARWFG